MPEQHLRDTLQHLRDELAAQTDLDRETADTLSGLLADITRLLDDRDSSGQTTRGGEDGSLTARLATATGDFETSHPKLTAALTQLAEALSAMGI